MLGTPHTIETAKHWINQKLLAAQLPASADIAAHEDATPAAVLVPIVWRESAPTVLLTIRSARLSQHAGQISFPGGRIEFEETPEEAALRETYEEVGIRADFIVPVGRLAQYTTVSRYRVTPVVGLLKPGFDLVLQADEVAEVFEVPLAFLLERSNFVEKVLNFPERRAVTYAVNWQGKIIWGATAGMLMTLYRTLNPDATSEPTP